MEDDDHAANSAAAAAAAGPAQELSSSAFYSGGAAFSLALLYVLSMYVWRSEHDRDHPSTIKRRFVSAGGMILVSLAFSHCFVSSRHLLEHDMWSLIGVRRAGLELALALPTLLTVLLFLGPLATLVCCDRARLLSHPYYWRRSLSDLIWWRNHVVAPFTEEFTFRACMVPILLGHFSERGAVVLSPLLFGVAHLHHMVERVRRGQDLRTAALISLFQMVYTSVFGAYSAFLFLRTGHLAAPVVIHGFCNFMGFPDFSELLTQPPKRRTLLLGAYMLGAGLFSLLLFPLTEPHIYHNDMYYR